MIPRYLAKVKKIGGSLSIIIPFDIAQMLRLGENDSCMISLEKVDKEVAKKAEYRERYDYVGTEGKILFYGKEIGKVKEIFFSTSSLKAGISKDNNPLNMEWKTIEFAHGLLFGNVDPQELHKWGLDFVGQMFELEVDCIVEDKTKKKMKIFIHGIKYQGKQGYVLKPLEFDAKIERRI